jgi:hypothetical protein
VCGSSSASIDSTAIRHTGGTVLQKLGARDQASDNRSTAYKIVLDVELQHLKKVQELLNLHLVSKGVKDHLTPIDLPPKH